MKHAINHRDLGILVKDTGIKSEKAETYLETHGSLETAKIHILKDHTGCPLMSCKAALQRHESFKEAKKYLLENKHWILKNTF